MNIGMLLLILIGGFAGLFLHFIFVSVFHLPLYGRFIAGLQKASRL